MADENFDDFSDSGEDTIIDFKSSVTSATQEQREEIDANIIASVPNVIKPDTPEAYLYGCLTDQSDGLNACAPSCLNGHQPKNMRSCGLAVYEKKNGKTTKLNKNKTATAYLYVAENDDECISKKELVQFHKEGISELFIYKQQAGILKFEHIETKILRKAKLMGKKGGAKGNSHQTDDQEKRSKSGWSHGWIIVVVIFIFLIIIIIIVYCCSGGTQGNIRATTVLSQKVTTETENNDYMPDC
jgi:hypothetical protein